MEERIVWDIQECFDISLDCNWSEWELEATNEQPSLNGFTPDELLGIDCKSHRLVLKRTKGDPLDLDYSESIAWVAQGPNGLVLDEAFDDGKPVHERYRDELAYFSGLISRLQNQA
jgi:hypothetical protein